MAIFLLQRTLLFVAALLVSSFVIYTALYLMPGDPIANLTGGRPLPPEAIEALRLRYHLDEPFLQRYVSWLLGVFRGDLGRSVIFNQDVSTMLGGKLVVTLQLVLYAGIIVVVLGLAAGIVAGLRKGAIDTIVMSGSAFLVAIPSYISAIVLLSVFAVTSGLFPAIGAGEPANRVLHLTLPAIALSLSSIAVVARVTRVAVRSEVNREHVQTARSRGMSPLSIVRRHILRNAVVPMLTVVGTSIAVLLAVTAIVEQAFSIDGLGSTLIRAAVGRDIAVVQAISLFYVLAFLVTNTVVDAVHGILDPRIRQRERLA